MGQTLTHGVYLPDEGERNCYSGLAANWQLLDNSVGTIAGKAPAVHTHTKSAITDLLNSNFIPSANNSYNLGSSSYQWNNVYSKNYFYNGVAWGLDKSNTWTGANIFYKSIQIHGGRNAYIMPELAASYSGLTFGTVEFKQSFKFGDWVDNNSTIGLNTSNAYVEIYAGLDSSDNINKVRLCPSPNATTAELGTATAKWKTFNCVNPGALSLPKGYTEEGADKHYINIASVIQTLDGTLYYYTMPDNGWISVRAEQANQVHVTTDNWKFGQSIYSNTVTTLIVSTPFRKGDTVAIKVIATTLEHARFYPMQGNV